ncbi:MAG: endonuclease III [Bacteroidales bacterium]|nr:endonuclease III [Bacteroidales bacterium]
MTKKEKYQFIVSYFEEHQPDVASELHFENAYQLLVATMLAAQCTDKRVNMVTPALFKAYPTPAAMSKAEASDILPYISSVSYPNSKADHLAKMSRTLVERFGGEVPSTMEELTELAGVGRKTANVVLAFAFNQAAMPVDTHVFRVSTRLGLVKDAPTPEAVEKQLVANFPKEFVSKAHHWLLLHGRYICMARKPKCTECPLTEICEEHRKMKNKEKF